MAAIAYWGGVILTSCDSVESDSFSDSEKITFVTAEEDETDWGVNTRAAIVSASDFNSKVSSFRVWGYFDSSASADGATPGGLFVGESATEGAVINGNGSGTWTFANSSLERFWPPTNSPLNFQAIAPASDASFTVTNSVSDNLAHMVANVTVPTDNSLQKDILMANEDGVTQSTHGRSVQLDFKHVLSQVRFKVQTASKQLSGDIEAISLCNIKSTGSVGYHAADDVTDGVNAWKKVVLGTTVSDDAVASYAIGMGDGSFGTAQFGAGNAKDVTADDGSLMMLPQTTSKWTTVDGTPVTVAAADAAKNTYIKISCKILNGNTYLVGSENSYGEVYIPFAASWTMGKKYIYTGNIGTGSGGFDVNGKPLVQPIS